MSANNEDLKKVTQRRRPHGPGARMMPGEKAADFKGSIGKLLRFMGQFKAPLICAIVFAIGSAAFNIVGPKVLSQATTELFEGIVAKVGGAGGIEAVFTALALRDQFAPPTIHYAQPDPECDLDYVPNTGRQQEMQYALSNSLGFGGHNACIALRRWEG